MSISYCDECEAIVEGDTVKVTLYCEKCGQESTRIVCYCGNEVVELPEDDWRQER